jgi:hypothetical protein
MARKARNWAKDVAELQQWFTPDERAEVTSLLASQLGTMPETARREQEQLLEDILERARQRRAAEWQRQ